MDRVTTDVLLTKKRKSVSDARSVPKAKRRRGEIPRSDSDLILRIEKLEDELSKTTNGKGQISELISFFDLASADLDGSLSAAICLCRVFSRMMASGMFPWQKSNEEPGWQMREYWAYQFKLLQYVKEGPTSTQPTMLKLSMRMLKEESVHNPDAFKVYESFSGLVTAIIQAVDGLEVRKTFAEDYLQPYHDCSYYSLGAIT